MSYDIEELDELQERIADKHDTAYRARDIALDLMKAKRELRDEENHEEQEVLEQDIKELEEHLEHILDNSPWLTE